MQLHRPSFFRWSDRHSARLFLHAESHCILKVSKALKVSKVSKVLKVFKVFKVSKVFKVLKVFKVYF